MGFYLLCNHHRLGILITVLLCVYFYLCLVFLFHERRGTFDNFHVNNSNGSTFIAILVNVSDDSRKIQNGAELVKINKKYNNTE